MTTAVAVLSVCTVALGSTSAWLWLTRTRPEPHTSLLVRDDLADDWTSPLQLRVGEQTDWTVQQGLYFRRHIDEMAAAIIANCNEMLYGPAVVS
jgi:hypothetical protein